VILALGVQGQFTCRPTITYSPLVGKRFARAFMAPIPLAAILSLIREEPAELRADRHRAVSRRSAAT
jgi:hypothetical protein